MKVFLFISIGRGRVWRVVVCQLPPPLSAFWLPSSSEFFRINDKVESSEPTSFSSSSPITVLTIFFPLGQERKKWNKYTRLIFLLDKKRGGRMGCENPSFSTNHHPCAAQCYSSDDYIDLFRPERGRVRPFFFPGGFWTWNVAKTGIKSSKSFGGQFWNCNVAKWISCKSLKIKLFVKELECSSVAKSAREIWILNFV